MTATPEHNKDDAGKALTGVRGNGPRDKFDRPTGTAYARLHNEQEDVLKRARGELARVVKLIGPDVLDPVLGHTQEAIDTITLAIRCIQQRRERHPAYGKPIPDDGRIGA